jgi:3-hydroxyisobutyrate dehydrogenase
MASSTTSNLPQHVGWIGLGLMGLPMATNLVKKIDKSTIFYVYDVMEESVKKFVEAGEGRVKACASSKEVADKSVCEQMSPLQYSKLCE